MHVDIVVFASVNVSFFASTRAGMIHARCVKSKCVGLMYFAVLEREDLLRNQSRCHALGQTTVEKVTRNKAVTSL
jgi:hypothetical protein